jgi:hypothetical protein
MHLVHRNPVLGFEKTYSSPECGLELKNSFPLCRNGDTWRKVLGYLPGFGVVIGIERVYIAVTKTPSSLIGRKIALITRGTLEFLGLGFLLMIPDLIATLFNPTQSKPIPSISPVLVAPPAQPANIQVFTVGSNDKPLDELQIKEALSELQKNPAARRSNLVIYGADVDLSTDPGIEALSPKKLVLCGARIVPASLLGEEPSLDSALVHCSWERNTTFKEFNSRVLQLPAPTVEKALTDTRVTRCVYVVPGPVIPPKVCTIGAEDNPLNEAQIRAALSELQKTPDALQSNLVIYGADVDLNTDPGIMALSPKKVILIGVRIVHQPSVVPRLDDTLACSVGWEQNHSRRSSYETFIAQIPVSSVEEALADRHFQRRVYVVSRAAATLASSTASAEKSTGKLS